MENLHEGSRGRTSLGKERRRGADLVQAHGGVPIGSPTRMSPSTSECVLGHGSDSTAAADLLADLLGWASLNFSLHTSHLERERGRGGCGAAAAGFGVDLAREEASPNLLIPVKLSALRIHARRPLGRC